MPGASYTSLSPLMKSHYADFVLDGVRNEDLLIKNFQTDTFVWDGLSVEIPFVYEGNSSIGYLRSGSNNALPAAGRRQSLRIIIDGTGVVAVGSIDWMEQWRMKKAGPGAFVNFWEAEVDSLKDDLTTRIDRMTVSGNVTKGILNEHKAVGNVNNASGVGAFFDLGAAVAFEYFGHYEEFASVVLGTIGSWVRVKLYRMDTYTELVPTITGGTVAAPNSGWFVCNKDEAACTITLQAASTDNTAVATTASSLVKDTLGAAFTSVNLAESVGIALVLHDTQLSAGGATFGTLGLHMPIAPATDIADVRNEWNGIFHNLCSQTHFTQRRNTKFGPNDGAIGLTYKLQSFVKTMATSTVPAGGAHGRTAIVGARIKKVVAEVSNYMKKKPNQMWINALTSAVAYANLTATTVFENTQAGQHTDFGPENFSIAGYKPKECSDVPQGGMILLNTSDKNWWFAELKELGWEEQGGERLMAVPGLASDQFLITWAAQLACLQPRNQAIICGTTI